MNKKTKKTAKGDAWGYLAAFLFGAGVYPMLELFWRGYTHITMSLLGGICMASIYFVYIAFSGTGFFLRALLSTVIITAWEFLFGAILNIALEMDVWNYSDMALNVMGQVCAPYAAIWLLLSAPALLVCRLIYDARERRIVKKT